MNEEAIARFGSHLPKNKYAQSISFGRDKALSLMLFLEQLLARSARRFRSDSSFVYCAYMSCSQLLCLTGERVAHSVLFMSDIYCCETFDV